MDTEGDLLPPFLRDPRRSAGNSGSGCGWPRWAVKAEIEPAEDSPTHSE